MGRESGVNFSGLWQMFVKREGDLSLQYPTDQRCNLASFMARLAAVSVGCNSPDTAPEVLRDTLEEC